MNVLVITGDKNVLREGTPAHERFLLQRSQVGHLEVVYWGKGSFFAPFKVTGQFNVVTVQDPFWRGLVGWVVARRLGASFNVQVHTDLRAQGFIKRFLASFVLRRADSVRAVSKSVAEQLSYLTVQVRTLPIYIDLSAVQAATSSSVLSAYPDITHMVLVSSRLEPEKNVVEAISAMRDIVKEIPGAGLFIAGDGSERGHLEQLAKEWAIEKHIFFLGFRGDIFSLYKEASVLLATSHYEGYGASVVEALAAGTPVVSPDTGIAREAGAVIAATNEYATKVIEVIKSGIRGQLKLDVVGKEAWARAWRNTLEV